MIIKIEISDLQQVLCKECRQPIDFKNLDSWIVSQCIDPCLMVYSHKKCREKAIQEMRIRHREHLKLVRTDGEEV